MKPTKRAKNVMRKLKLNDNEYDLLEATSVVRQLDSNGWEGFISVFLVYFCLFMRESSYRYCNCSSSNSCLATPLLCLCIQQLVYSFRRDHIYINTLAFVNGTERE